MKQLEKEYGREYGVHRIIIFFVSNPGCIFDSVITATVVSMVNYDR